MVPKVSKGVRRNVRLAAWATVILTLALAVTHATAQPALNFAAADGYAAKRAGAASAPQDASMLDAPDSPPAGLLDPAFDSDGKVTTDFGSSWDQAVAVAIQSDGKIVAAGYAYSGSNSNFALARYNSDGSLDASFDGDGLVTTDFGGSTDWAGTVVVQSDGKILAAGSAVTGSDNDFALARYNNDGSLDASFDGDGKVTTDFGSSHDWANAMAIQSDGKIVAAGTVRAGSDTDFALARYNSDGSLDASFGGDGQVTTAIGSSTDWASAVVIQSDGKIVAAGHVFNGVTLTYDFALARYNGDGSLDTSFDGDGKVTTAVGISDDEARAVVIQSDGKIVAAGWAVTGSTEDFALARYNSNGSLDASFDGDGKVTTAVGSSHDEAQAVAIQSNGKIVAVGSASDSSNADFALTRYNSTGSLDASFDGDGKVTTAIGGSNDYAHAVAIQSDGKIVVAGYTTNGSNWDFALARYQVASTSSRTIADDGSATLEDITITNRSAAACALTVTKYPIPPGGRPADAREMPMLWHVSTDCATYNFDLVFHYTDTELLFGNHVTEVGLQAYRSANGNDFSLVGGAINSAGNTVTVDGVTQLSWWGLISSPHLWLPLVLH